MAVGEYLIMAEQASGLPDVERWELWMEKERKALAELIQEKSNEHEQEFQETQETLTKNQR